MKVCTTVKISNDNAETLSHIIQHYKDTYPHDEFRVSEEEIDLLAEVIVKADVIIIAGAW